MPALPYPPRRRPDVARPPGPAAGTVLRSLVSRTPSRPVELLTELARTYPRIAYTRVANDHVYLLTHPDLVRELLTTHGRVTVKSQGLRVLRHLFGQGLLTSEGELHKRQRRMVQPAFHRERIAGYAQEMAAAAAEHGRRWEEGMVDPVESGTGLAVDMYAEMSALTLAVVGRTLFGSDLRGNVDRVARGLEETMRQYRRFLLPFGDRMLRMPLPWSLRTRSAGRQLDNVIREIIGARRASVASGAAAEAGDLLSMLMLAQEDGAGMTDEQLRDEVMTLMLAGHETTASTLSWAWYLLATHPRVSAALYAEVDARLGERPPACTDLTRLPFANAVIAETLRLYPPACPWGASSPAGSNWTRGPFRPARRAWSARGRCTAIRGSGRIRWPFGPSGGCGRRNRTGRAAR